MILLPPIPFHDPVSHCNGLDVNDVHGASTLSSGVLMSAKIPDVNVKDHGHCPWFLRTKDTVCISQKKSVVNGS